MTGENNYSQRQQKSKKNNKHELWRQERQGEWSKGGGRGRDRGGGVGGGGESDVER